MGNMMKPQNKKEEPKTTKTEAVVAHPAAAPQNAAMMNMMGSIMGSMMKPQTKKEPQAAKKDPAADMMKMLLGAVSGAQGGAKKMTSLLQTMGPAAQSPDDPLAEAWKEGLKDVVCGFGDNVENVDLCRGMTPESVHEIASPYDQILAE